VLVSRGMVKFGKLLEFAFARRYIHSFQFLCRRSEFIIRRTQAQAAANAAMNQDE
jgi:hypothetical protein